MRICNEHLRTSAAAITAVPAAIEACGMRGEMRLNEPMARHTSWRVGGPADRLYTPTDTDDLAGFLATLPAGEPLTFIGLGSNLLVRDGGIRGTVVQMKNTGAELHLDKDGTLKSGAGVPCAKVARFSGSAGLTGAEFLAGIPGTMGGALAMNAGAFGGETWDIVTRVETIDRSGACRVREAGEYQIDYRRVRGPDGEWFLSAWLRLPAAAGQDARHRIRELLALRSDTQPLGEFSCGSVFRNPPGDYAARLIEVCGLKGRRHGGAQVSEKHANFIVNTGNASAADIEGLIEAIAAVVRSDCGIELEREVCIIGTTGNDGHD